MTQPPPFDPPDLNAYRVAPEAPVRLDSWPTRLNPDFSRADAEARQGELADELFRLQERLYAESQQGLLVVLQARDAGGKDGTIKHVFRGLNPQGVRVTSFKQPTAQELAHDFLWRIHRAVPSRGMIGIFNRSHYEDVLVTRVYDMIDDTVARQRLEHIRNFERLLEGAGTRIVKIYLHIGREEQRKRLQDRLDDPAKHWKFDPGDLRDRANWDHFTRVYEEALGASSTDTAPWFVIPADRKWLRNYLMTKLLLHTLQDMNPQFPQSPADVTEHTVE